MTSKLIFKVQFCHNQFEKPLFGQITHFSHRKLKIKGRWGAESSRQIFVTRMMHFRYISAKIQPKNLILVHY